MAPAPPKDGFDAAVDAAWMRVALALGRREQGRVWPNPAVGCVIVAPGGPRGVVVGRGWTQPGGRPHAEAMALAAAGSRAAGARAFITLEPCAHHGVTPPCAIALAEAGVAEVVTALEDPDPRVSGRGHALLRAAGVSVREGVCAAEAKEDHAGFFTRLSAQRPWVTLKLAASLDGRIALASGESRWISAAAARERAHMLRAENDAVLIGAGTARADDPRLTVRLPGMAAASPVRVVADSALSLALDSRLAQSAHAPALWIAHAPEAEPARKAALAARGARLLETPRAAEGDGLDAAALLARLGAEGVTRLMCEGGGRLSASLIAAGLVDRLVLVAAGVAIGGDGLPALGAMGLAQLSDAARFDLVALERLGEDVWSEWRPRPA